MVGKHETSTQTNDLEIRQKNLQTKRSKRTPTDEKAEKHSQKRGKETTKQHNQHKHKIQTRTNTKTERRGSKNTDQTGVEQRRRTTDALLLQPRKTETGTTRDHATDRPTRKDKRKTGRGPRHHGGLLLKTIHQRKSGPTITGRNTKRNKNPQIY